MANIGEIGLRGKDTLREPQGHIHSSYEATIIIWVKNDGGVDQGVCSRDGESTLMLDIL